MRQDGTTLQPVNPHRLFYNDLLMEEAEPWIKKQGYQSLA
jgi:hypothetical protein